MKRFRVTTRSGADATTGLRVHFDIRECVRCGRIHVPAHVLMEILRGESGTRYRIEQRIVIGSCGADQAEEQEVTG